MQSKAMDIAIFWFPLLGGVLLGGIAGSAWYGGNKSLGLWLGFAGAICFALVAVLQIQDRILKAGAESPPSDTDRLRAYVLVEASELRYLASERPIEGWVSLKNNGLTPAFDLQRWATIFATKFPHTAFERAEFSNARSVLGPSGAVDFGPIRMSRTLTYDERSAVARGEMAIYVYGEIKYKDTFKIARCTNFRLMYRGNGSISAGPVPLEQLPEGNNYDCPDAAPAQ
jgi:hypothetical protein